VYWPELDRQVRVEGDVARVDDTEADTYFASRPRESQIGAWASPQSEELADRAELEALVAAAEARFAGSDVPRPPHWGGWLLIPDVFEFWQGRPSRLHDRICYEKDGSSWRRFRLYP
jgi:pyridoxamine 5'-phosphate oxidase